MVPNSHDGDVLPLPFDVRPVREVSYILPRGTGPFRAGREEEELVDEIYRRIVFSDR